MKEEFALAGGYGAAGLGPFVAVTVLSPLRGRPPATGMVVFVLIVAIAFAAVLAGPVIGAVATVNAGLCFNFLFVPPYGILKADGFVGWPTACVLAAGLTLVVGTRRKRTAPTPGAAPPHARSTRDAIRPASRHIERVARLIADGADQRDLISAVEIEVTSLLILRRCRFEPESTGVTIAAATGRLPRLERDGTVSGSAREPERLEIPVRTDARAIGRFVLDLTPGVSVPFEHRLGALILADHLAAAIAARHTSSPLT